MPFPATEQQSGRAVRQSSLLLTTVMALILLASAATEAPSSYDCPAACDALPACKCASLSPPGGLAPQETPQFIILTNDDAVTARTLTAVRNVIGPPLANRNGCPVPATWFVCPLWNASGWEPQYTDPALVRSLYLGGHEIATHTLTHPFMPSAEEIVGARTWLNEAAGVPVEALRGFRAPYLAHDEAQREVLRLNGFLYDSSLTTQWGSGQASPNGSTRIWPWTMDYGTPIACGSCPPGERQPGLWELPLYAVQDEQGRVLAYTDPGTSWGPDPAPELDNFVAYRREFVRSYSGNRAPVGIYLHAEMLIRYPAHQAQLAAFLRWALAHEGVWAVTVSEVLRWMKDPVPAAQYELECSRGTTAGDGSGVGGSNSQLHIRRGSHSTTEPSEDATL